MHCSNHVRESFLSWLDSVGAGAATLKDDVIDQKDGEIVSVTVMLGRLQNCTDVLPRSYYDQLDMSGKQTYAAAVRSIRQVR